MQLLQSFFNNNSWEQGKFQGCELPVTYWWLHFPPPFIHKEQCTRIENIWIKLLTCTYKSSFSRGLAWFWGLVWGTGPLFLLIGRAEIESERFYNQHWFVGLRVMCRKLQEVCDQVLGFNTSRTSRTGFFRKLINAAAWGPSSMGAGEVKICGMALIRTMHEKYSEKILKYESMK